MLQSDPIDKVRKKAPRDYDKLITASRLATRLGMKTRTLVDRLIGHGYVQMDGREVRLTDAGRRVGGEARVSPTNGDFIVWPADLQV